MKELFQGMWAGWKSLTPIQVMDIILLIGCLWILYTLWKAHKSNDPRYDKFDFTDLITAKNGKISLPKLAEFTALIATTWGYIVYVNKGILPEWYMQAYIVCWILRAGYTSWLAKKPDAEQTVTSSKESSSETTTTGPGGKNEH